MNISICEKAVNYRYQPGSPDENDLLVITYFPLMLSYRQQPKE